MRAILNSLVAFLLVGLSAAAMMQGARADERADLNDVARLLAGQAPSAHSVLAGLANDPQWTDAAKRFDTAWGGLEREQIPRIKAWAAKHVPGRPAVLFYMFSGPDFIYADAFFGHVATFVLSGMEPVGDMPDVMALPAGQRAHALACVRARLDHYQNYGFFITEALRAAGEHCEFKGNLPILLVALARTGKVIKSATFVAIGRDGALLPLPGTPADESKVYGVKIEFQDAGGRLRTLYYFKTDLSDIGVDKGGFLAFCKGMGNGVALLKGASYLLHEAAFSQTRAFILQQADTIVEDDTGIPLRYFYANEWQITPFGDYETPISPFRHYDQPSMQALFLSGRPEPIDFGFGYRWRSEDANLIVFERKGTALQPRTPN